MIAIKEQSNVETICRGIVELTVNSTTVKVKGPIGTISAGGGMIRFPSDIYI